MAIDIEQINLKFTASAGNVSKTFTALENRLKQVGRAFENIDTSKIDSICAQMDRLSASMSGFTVNSEVNGAIKGMVTAMNKLNKLDVANIERSASAIHSLGSAFSSFPTMSMDSAQAVSAMAHAMRQFGLKGASAGVSGIEPFVKAISGLSVAFEQINAERIAGVAEALRNLAETLNILGRTKVDKAIANLPLLAKEMENLMQSLARAPTISQNVIQMTNALANLASNGSKVGTATSGLNRALRNTNTAGKSGARGLDIFSRSAKSQRAHIKSLASVVGGLIAKYWLLWRAVQLMANMAGVASSLVEVQNVVDHTFGQMSYKLDEFAKTSIEDFGLSTLALKQYASRYQSMGMAMGITNSQVANSADFLSAHMSDEAKALYNTSESLADMSINLTKLAADYASFYDVDPAETFEKFQSVMTGQTRPLRAYGLSLDQTTLKEWALKNGLDADIDSMTQAEKTLLRYQYVMAQSNHILGDFARTSDTYHNTLTKLKANFQTLKGTIGTSLMNLFKPILVVVNNAIVVINQFAKAVGDSLGKILGWRYEVGSGAVALDDTADYMDDVADSAGGAGKAVKDLKRQLQGFDELNLLTTNDNNGGGGGSGGSGLGGAGGASNLAGEWVREDSLFDSDWDTWFKLGRGISEAWTAGLNAIDWNEVYQAASDWGTGLASFLNGLITPDLFGALGSTLAGALNTVVYGALSFGDNFDWENAGKSISEFVNKLFEKVDWVSAGKAAFSLQGGILDMLITAIEGVDWYKVGESIGDYISNLNIPDLLEKMTHLALDIASALYDALCGLWNNTSVTDKIGLAIFGLIKFAGVPSLVGLLTGKITGGLGGGSINIPGTIAATVAIAFAFQAGNKVGSTIGALLSEFVIDDPDLADMYIEWGNMTLVEKVKFVYESIDGWDDSDTQALKEAFKDFIGDEQTFIPANNQNLGKAILGGRNGAYDNFFGNEELKNLPSKYANMLGKIKINTGIFAKQQIKTWDDLRKAIVADNKEVENSSTSTAETVHSGMTGKFGDAIRQITTDVNTMKESSTNAFGTMASVAFAKTNDVKGSVSTNTAESARILGLNLTNMSETNSQKLGVMQNDTSKWSSKVMEIVNGTKANATLGTNMTAEKTVSDRYGALKAIWKNHTADYKVDPKNNSGDVQRTWSDIASHWTSKAEQFHIVAENSAGEIKRVWDEMANNWQNKTSTYTMNFDSNVTGGGVSAGAAGALAGAQSIAKTAMNSFLGDLEQKLRKVSVLKNIKLQRFAEGGIVNQPTLGLFGEAGREAIMPLENNTEWLGRMANMIVSEMEYHAPSNVGTSAYSNNEQSMREQNDLLREQNRLLQMIAQKDVTISANDVFNATRSESENYYNRTGNSPFIF